MLLIITDIRRANEISSSRNTSDYLIAKLTRILHQHYRKTYFIFYRI